MPLRVRWLTALLLSVCCVMNAQSFHNPRRIATPVDPDAVYAGDLNGDGVPDLLYGTTSFVGTTPTAVLHPLLADGKGNYTPGTDLALPVTVSTRCRLGDLNEDGKLDLVCGGAGESSLLVVMLGNGDGTFQAGLPVTLPVQDGGYGIYAAAIADLNHDGHVDVVVTGGAYQYFVLQGDGTGHLTLGATIEAGGSPALVQVADLNGDGNPDLIATGTLGDDTEVALGHGDGTFAAPVRYVGNSGTVLADVDGDGHVDLIGGGDGVLKIFHGNADGSFGTTPIAMVDYTDGTYNGTGLGVYEAPLACLDLNGDGIPDIVATGKDGLTVLLGQPGLKFATPVSYTVGATSSADFPTNLSLVDLNGDGHVDLLSRGPNGVYISNGLPNGTFATADVYLSGRFVSMATVADFNEDGNPDVVTSGDAKLMISMGRADGTFSQATAIPIAVLDASVPNAEGYHLVAHGDVNGDGHQDLVVLEPTADGVPATFLLAGHGDGSFSSPKLVAEDKSYDVLTAVLDMNLDGRADPVLLNVGAETVTVYLTQSDGSFKAVQSALATTNNEYLSQTVALGDLDGDGIPDLVYTTTLHIAVMKGQGDGSFGPPLFFALPQVQGSTYQDRGPAAIGDFDGDGLPDIAVVVPFSRFYADFGPTQIFTFYRQGSGSTLDANSFTAAVPGPVTLRSFYELDAADLDGDGRTDLIATGSEYLPAPSAISVFPGAANRVLGPEIDFVAGEGLGPLSIVDLNHDGRLDIVTGNDVANAFTVLLSEGPGETTGTLTATPDPTLVGTGFQITAKITPPAEAGAGVLSGSATFSIDGIALGTATLSGNVATLAAPATLAVGTHRLTAVSSTLSNGIHSYPAVHLSGTEVISALPVAVTLTAAPNPVTAGKADALVTMVGNGGGVAVGAATPTGTISIAVNGTAVGAVAAPGSATGLSYTFAAAGSYTVAASYGGDASHAGGTATTVVVVNPVPVAPSFTLQLTPVVVRVSSKQAASVQIGLTSLGGFTGTLTLTHGQLPAGFAAIFVPSTVPLAANAAGSAQLQISPKINPGASAGAAVHGGRTAAVLLSGTGLLLLPMVARRRRWSHLLMAVLAGVLLAGLQGCGESGVPLQVVTPGVYVVPVTATDAVSQLSQSGNLTVVVSENGVVPGPR